MTTTKPVRVFLSRRNLLSLLSKLDRVAEGQHSYCTIVKRDTEHPTHPQTHPEIELVAVEDGDYYVERSAGFVHPFDEPRNTK